MLRQRARDDIAIVIDRERPGYRIPSGFQMLFYGNGRPITVVNHYLMEVTTSCQLEETDWKQTQQSYADDAAQGTIFLWSKRKTWDDVSVELAVDFYIALRGGYSVWTRQKLESSTVNRRLSTFLRIARFARRNGYPTGDGDFANLKPKDVRRRASSKIAARGGTIFPSQRRPLPKVNPILNLKPVLDALGDDILKSPKGDCRDRLYAETSLHTGMRVDEIAELTVRDILFLASEAATKPHQKNFAIWITKTKGSIPGYVVFPRHLIDALIRYVETERAEVVLEARKRLGAAYLEPPNLFLNGLSANDRDIGKARSPAAISKAFTRAVSRCGQMIADTRFELRADRSLASSEEGAPIVEHYLRPAHNFHDLRHTFAVVLYFDAVRRGIKNPLKHVSILLRHALTETTSNLYLRWVDVFERELAQLLADYYRDLDASITGVK